MLYSTLMHSNDIQASTAGSMYGCRARMHGIPNARDGDGEGCAEGFKPSASPPSTHFPISPRQHVRLSGSP